MNFIGTIIEESLEDKSVLKKVIILGTKIEKSTSKHQTPWVKQWTIHSVEIAASKADETAELLQWSFDPTHPQWYADFKNEAVHYIIFNGQTFKFGRNDTGGYKDARDYGISIGIPENHLAFSSGKKD